MDNWFNKNLNPKTTFEADTTPKKTRKEEGTPVNSIVSVKRP
jgi:hypothetical protein